MKGQRWKHIVVEEEKEEGLTIFEKMKSNYRGGRVKKRVGSHNYSQKTCKTHVFQLDHRLKCLKNVFFVV